MYSYFKQLPVYSCLLHIYCFVMYVAGDFGCEEGGCLGEHITFDGKWPTLADCHNSGGKCCAQNVNGAAPFTHPRTNVHGDCWYCFSEWGSGTGYTNLLPEFRG